MCELLGMSANTPTDLCFSFTGLTRRGGETGPHKDGWGVAFYEGKGVRTFHDPEPSATSPIAEFVSQLPIKSKTAIPHFVRRVGMYEAVGDTDSEEIFCDLMNQLRQNLPRDAMPEQLARTLVSLAEEYAQQGVFNCLLSNGDWLFTFCTTKMASITRRAPFGPAQLADADVTVDFAAETTPNDVVSVIATEPLTADEDWDVYEQGEWKLWQLGEVIVAGKVEVPGNSHDRTPESMS